MPELLLSGPQRGVEIIRFYSLTPNGGETRMRSAGDSVSFFSPNSLSFSRTSHGSACFSTRAGPDPARRSSAYQSLTQSTACLSSCSEVIRKYSCGRELPAWFRVQDGPWSKSKARFEALRVHANASWATRCITEDMF